MGSTAEDITNLVGKVQALPAELFNKILDLTFCSLTRKYHIDLGSKPPSWLQVNKSTRSKALKSYFGESTFYVRQDALHLWTASLPLDQIDVLHEVRVCVADGALYVARENRSNLELLYRAILPAMQLGNLLNEYNVKIPVFFEPNGERIAVTLCGIRALYLESWKNEEELQEAAARLTELRRRRVGS